MMKRQSRGEVVVVAMVVAMAWCGWMTAAEGADDLSTKCAEVVQKVIPCLDFASGKEAAPKKECCDATASIKESNPECLCFVIQQTHKGSPQIKSLGIQEDKLLQLPSLCKVKNATITDCPSKLSHTFSLQNFTFSSLTSSQHKQNIINHLFVQNPN